MVPSNKREIIQKVLAREQELWIIIKPSRLNPADPEPLCIFENPAEYTRAEVNIPISWFQNHDPQKVQRVIKESLRDAKPKYRFQRAE